MVYKTVSEAVGNLDDVADFIEAQAEEIDALSKSLTAAKFAHGHASQDAGLMTTLFSLSLFGNLVLGCLLYWKCV